MQDGDFATKLKVVGTGTFEVGVSVTGQRASFRVLQLHVRRRRSGAGHRTVQAQRAARLPRDGERHIGALNFMRAASSPFPAQLPW